MPATTTSSRYRDQWESPRHPAWSDFWRNHRGRTLLDDILRHPPLERFLDVRPVSALTMLDVPTVTTRGSPFKLLVREEMLRFAQRFRDARGMPGQAIEGVVLLGQSGIGKTALLVFFLLQCLSMEERVVLATRYGVTYLFDECGVAALKSKSTSGFVAIEHLPGHVDNTPRLWSLVDCPLSAAPSPSSVTLDARPRMFFMAALSPDESRRYKPFEGGLSIRAWWMSRWSDDELLALLRHICSPFPERQSVRSVRETAGPVPRDILRLLVYPGGCDRQVAQELDFHSLQPTMVFISGAEAFSNEAEVCPGPAANANAGVVLVLWAVQIAGKREDPARPSASGPGGFGMAVRRLRECTRAVCPPGVPVEVEVKYALVVPVRQRRHGRRSARV